MAECLSERAFVTLDVFTDTAFSGNPLAIVLGADDLSTAQMQTLAREFNLSETLFVMAPRDPGNTARVRIFLPQAEIPFAGHPTVGCAVHLAMEGAPDGDMETDIRLEEEAGLVPVHVSRRDGQIAAEFTAPLVPHPAREGQIPETSQLAAALGLHADQIGFGAHRPGLFEGGPKFLFLPVRDLTALSAARPSEPAWGEAMALAGLKSAYLYTPRPEGCDFQARMFSPGGGIPEDPATGSASAILAAQLLRAGALGPQETRFRLRQGMEMGRPSQIGLTVRCDGDQISEVRISGSAVPVSRGYVRLPA